MVDQGTTRMMGTQGNRNIIYQRASGSGQLF
uniref:Uncharacterized protein n=1 Tax=Rhizophora mucronata TaxID=61149 RepID=A0A2P2IUN6_RHIMU